MAQCANATNLRYYQLIVNKQHNIFWYLSLVASSEVYINVILILESRRVRNKTLSRRLFGVLACMPKSVAYFSDVEIPLLISILVIVALTELKKPGVEVEMRDIFDLWKLCLSGIGWISLCCQWIFAIFNIGEPGNSQFFDFNRIH